MRNENDTSEIPGGKYRKLRVCCNPGVTQAAVGISACTSGVKSHTAVPHVLWKGIISVSRRIQHALKDKVTTINHHLMSYNSNQDIFP